jgi:4a-hydroxytetrahydrobiopterin dehydratase
MIEGTMATAPTRTALTATQIIASLAKIEGWKLHGDGPDTAIGKTFRFNTFLQTMAFANAVAFLSEQQDHHPEMLLRFGSCSVRFNTHTPQGITATDIACAALVDALVAKPAQPA